MNEKTRAARYAYVECFENRYNGIDEQCAWIGIFGKTNNVSEEVLLEDENIKTTWTGICTGAVAVFRRM